LRAISSPEKCRIKRAGYPRGCRSQKLRCGLRRTPHKGPGGRSDGSYALALLASGAPHPHMLTAAHSRPRAGSTDQHCWPQRTRRETITGGPTEAITSIGPLIGAVGATVATGPTGPTGPAGAAGQSGAIGPPNAVDVTTAETNLLVMVKNLFEIGAFIVAIIYFLYRLFGGEYILNLLSNSLARHHLITSNW
jgi:hypothetical protein